MHLARGLAYPDSEKTVQMGGGARDNTANAIAK